MKRRALICLLLIISFLLCGCGHIGDEEEVLKAAEDIFRRADVIETVFYGEGLPLKEGEGVFREVDFSRAEGMPFRDEESLRAFLERYCSGSLCDALWASGKYEIKNGNFVMNTSVFQIGGRSTFVLSDLKVVSIGNSRSRVKIPVLTEKNGERTEWVLEAELLYEDGDWKLATEPIPSEEK